MNPEKENLQKFKKIATETNKFRKKKGIKQAKAERGVGKTNDTAVILPRRGKRDIMIRQDL